MIEVRCAVKFDIVNLTLIVHRKLQDKSEAIVGKSETVSPGTTLKNANNPAYKKEESGGPSGWQHLNSAHAVNRMTWGLIGI